MMPTRKLIAYIPSTRHRPAGYNGQRLPACPFSKDCGMLRSTMAGLCFVFLRLLCCGAPTLGDDAPIKETPLQGYWKVAQTRWAGNRVEMFGWELNFAGEQLTISDENKIWSGKLKFHAGGDRDALDMQLDKQTISMRYQLRGDTLLLALPNGLYGSRPRGLESSDGDYSEFVLTLKRQKPPAVVTGDDTTAKT